MTLFTLPTTVYQDSVWLVSFALSLNNINQLAKMLTVFYRQHLLVPLTISCSKRSSQFIVEQSILWYCTNSEHAHRYELGQFCSICLHIHVIAASHDTNSSLNKLQGSGRYHAVQIAQWSVGRALDYTVQRGTSYETHGITGVLHHNILATCATL